MYNLFVSSNEESWNGDPWIQEESRCIREYTDLNLRKEFGELTSTQIDKLRRFPCIFAYEESREKNPKFGLIRDVVRRQGKVKVDYELIELEKFISYSDISKYKFELDISDWEMNRTHWALKDVNLARELAQKGFSLPSWTRNDEKSVDISAHTFDVAISFPGEVRNYVELICSELERLIGPHSYFYDNNYKAQLARPSLDILLQDIYKNRSRLVVVFLCEKYQEKEWCGIEFRVIREIIKEKDHQKIMFVKMDAGKVDGVFSTDGYIDGNNHSPAEVAKFINERVSLLS